MDVDEIWLSLLIIAAISLCLPIVTPTPSLSQLFIFFKSIWQSWTIFFGHLVSSCPVAASVMCCVFKKSVCGFPLELTYLTKTTNCWRTEMSVRLVKALCCPFFFFLFQYNVCTLVMASKDTTSEFCVSWYLELCVWKLTFCAGSWCHIRGLTLGVHKPLMFVGLGYWSTFLWVFSSGILCFMRLLTNLASSTLTELSLFSLGSKSCAISCSKLLLSLVPAKAAG